MIVDYSDNMLFWQLTYIILYDAMNANYEVWLELNIIREINKFWFNSKGFIEAQYTRERKVTRKSNDDDITD